MHDATDLGAASASLDALFPAGAASVLSLALPPSATLWPGELVAAAHFSPARRTEFCHGRDCARRALERLGVGPRDIASGQHREPLWPAGIVGSISHAGGAAAAVVAREHALRGLGLDIEPEKPLDAALVSVVCNPAELNRLRAEWPDPDFAALIVFSAKEAVYKALWPLAHRFLEFSDVQIWLDSSRHRFKAAVPGDGAVVDLADRLEGRFARVAGLVAAGAALI